MKCNCQSNSISPQICGYGSIPAIPYANFPHCQGGYNNFTHYMQLIAENHTLIFQVKKLEKKLAELEAKKDEDKNGEKDSTNCETVEKLLKEEQERSSKYASELDELKAKMKNFGPIPF